MGTRRKSCAVASPKQCNCATILEMYKEIQALKAKVMQLEQRPAVQIVSVRQPYPVYPLWPYNYKYNLLDTTIGGCYGATSATDTSCVATLAA